MFGGSQENEPRPTSPRLKEIRQQAQSSSTDSPLPMFFFSIWFPWDPVWGWGRLPKYQFVFCRKNKEPNIRMQKERERESIKKCIRDLYLRISNTYHFQKPSSKANFEGSSLTGISSCVLWSKYPNREELSPQDLELFSIQLTTQNCHVLFWGLRLTNSSRLGF